VTNVTTELTQKNRALRNTGGGVEG